MSRSPRRRAGAIADSVVAVLAILVGAGSPGCQAASPRRATEDRVVAGAAARPCLSIERLRRSEILDSRTILFHLVDGTIVRSRLAQPCYGLLLQGGFAFAAPTAQICELDLIRVLGPSGTVCALGPFDLDRLAPGAQAPF